MHLVLVLQKSEVFEDENSAKTVLMNYTKDSHINQTENLLVNDSENSCGEVGL